MKINSMHAWMICGLGAVDGLVVGFLIEVFRVAYEKHRIEGFLQQAAEQNQSIGYLLSPRMDLLIPTISAIAFAAISHLIYRYLTDRPRGLLVFWLIAGIGGGSAGLVMTGLPRDPVSFLSLLLFAGISYSIFRLWSTNLNSLPFLWEVIGLSTVLTVAAGVQIIGLFAVQRVELRQPLTWLLCLVLVLFVNIIFGLLLRLRFPQSASSAMHSYD